MIEEQDTNVRIAVYEITLARAWYSVDRRDPAWRRRSVDETESLLESLGLTGPFWNLR